MSNLEPSVYGLAIDAMSPNNFEVFGQSVLFEVLGIEFEPTGGNADGGADGFLRAKKGRSTQFIQISKEKDVRSKVRKTLVALGKAGRAVESLTFLTSENFPTRDQFEDEIEKSTGVQLRIHDRSWIAVQIEQNATLQQRFKERAAATIKNVEEIASTAIQAYSQSERMSVLVYMDAHARSTPSETDLLSLAVDAAIYKALEGTDPDTGVFRTGDEVIAFVEKEFPAVKNRPGMKVADQLDRLSKKANNPRIRRYQKEDKYCLPHDVRDELSQENSAVRQLELEFVESLRERAKQTNYELSAAEVDVVAGAALASLAQTFEHQGMNLAASFEANPKFEDVKTFEFVRDAIPIDKHDNERRAILREATSKILRDVIYSGTPKEREYLFKLFKLYSIEFVTKGDDKVASFFRNSLKTLRLVVGTDILLRALSECCVNAESQATQNALKYLSKAGVQLYLSELVLDELYTHIIAENREFDGNYRSWYQYASLDELKQCDRILLRAFFYSNKEPERHQFEARSWENYLDRIGNHEWFVDRSKREYFSTFLIEKFGLTSITGREIDDVVKNSDVKRLKDKIIEMRSGEAHERLAENDARHALYINKRRERDGETMSANVYGYNTWWLMEEFQVISAAQALRMPWRFSIHPQFLMNFCIISPRLRDLTEEFKPFFPTNFGLRITERVGSGTMERFIRKAKQAAEKDPAVAKAEIRSLGDKIREAFYKS